MKGIGTGLFALATWLLSAATLQPLFAQDNPAYIEQNGLIVIQMESATNTGQWVLESSESGYTGAGYLRWDGPNHLNQPGNGLLEFRLLISEPGEYNVKARMSHLGAPAGDQENDYWARMDNGDDVKAVHPSPRKDDGFTFHTILEPKGGQFESSRYYLDAGYHTYYISGRSHNLRIDRLHIYKDGVADPQNLSYGESPREGSTGGSGTLTVVNGSGSGTYDYGTVVNITANPPNGDEVFDKWTGPVGYLANQYASSTTVTMPSSNITLTATYRVDDLRSPENPVDANAGLQYEYYEQRFDELPNFDFLTPVKTGTVSTVNLNEADREDEYGFRFFGYVDAPTDGTYTFYTASDDGSRLDIGNVMVVENDSIQSVQERSGQIGLKAGKHAITVTYFERTGDQDLIVSWEGPGIAKTPIPASAYFHGGVVGTGGSVLGDVSLNGEVSALDAAQILIHTAGQSILDPPNLAMAEVSGNHEVTAYDASLILQYVVGIIDCFPADVSCSSGKKGEED